MRMTHHGRYAYQPITDRPHYDWPCGKSLAFYIAITIEHFHFGEGLGHTPSYLTLQPDVRNYAWRDYGLRVGIWRLFHLLDELALPACLLVNAAAYDHAPQIMARGRQRGDEVLGHGRSDLERQGDLDEAQERALIAEATAIIASHEGRRPKGWLGPWISETLVTPDLLKEAGYDYVLDWPLDYQPVWLATRAGPLLSVAYPVKINDAPAGLAHHQSELQPESQISKGRCARNAGHDGADTAAEYIAIH